MSLFSGALIIWILQIIFWQQNCALFHHFKMKLLHWYSLCVYDYITAAVTNTQEESVLWIPFLKLLFVIWFETANQWSALLYCLYVFLKKTQIILDWTSDCHSDPKSLYWQMVCMHCWYDILHLCKIRSFPSSNCYLSFIYFCKYL